MNIEQDIYLNVKFTDEYGWVASVATQPYKRLKKTLLNASFDVGFDPFPFKVGTKTELCMLFLVTDKM